MSKKPRSIKILLEKAKSWKDLSNHCLGQGRHEEATEYHIRSKVFYEAASIVEGCDSE